MVGDTPIGYHTRNVRGRIESYAGDLKDGWGAGWLGCEICVCEF